MPIAIIDFHTWEIVTYVLSEKANKKQIQRMILRFERRYGNDLDGAIIHSDERWQYQQKRYQDFLPGHNIRQPVSRKGDCLDNSPTENFFGGLKEEMFYGWEWRYEAIDDLRTTIERWNKYYNEKRMVTILKTTHGNAQHQMMWVKIKVRKRDPIYNKCAYAFRVWAPIDI